MASELLEKAATLRDTAKRALRLAAEINDADRKRLIRFGEDLREQADELERQAAAEAPLRSLDQGRGQSVAPNAQKPKKGSGSNDPEPQA